MKRNIQEIKLHSKELKKMTMRTIGEILKNLNIFELPHLDYLEQHMLRLHSENGGRIGKEVIWWEKIGSKTFINIIINEKTKIEYEFKDFGYKENLCFIEKTIGKNNVTLDHTIQSERILAQLRHRALNEKQD